MTRQALLAGLVAVMLAGATFANGPPAVEFTFEPTTPDAQASGNPDYAGGSTEQ